MWSLVLSKYCAVPTFSRKGSTSWLFVSMSELPASLLLCFGPSLSKIRVTCPQALRCCDSRSDDHDGYYVTGGAHIQQEDTRQRDDSRLARDFIPLLRTVCNLNLKNCCPGWLAKVIGASSRMPKCCRLDPSQGTFLDCGFDP